MKTNRSVILIFLAFIMETSPLTAHADPTSRFSNEIPVYTYFIVNKIPHDHQAYTQGLAFNAGYLYESTGRRGYSSLRKLDPNSGGILNSHQLLPLRLLRQHFQSTTDCHM